MMIIFLYIVYVCLFKFTIPSLIWVNSFTLVFFPTLSASTFWWTLFLLLLPPNPGPIVIETTRFLLCAFPLNILSRLFKKTHTTMGGCYGQSGKKKHWMSQNWNANHFEKRRAMKSRKKVQSASLSWAMSKWCRCSSSGGIYNQKPHLPHHPAHDGGDQNRATVSSRSSLDGLPNI